MIDLTTEHALNLAEAAKRYGSFRQGKAPHVSRVLRHITKGIRAPDGNIIHLEGLRLGGQWVTTVEAIQRFAERLTPNLSASTSTPVRTPAARSRAAERVDRELTAAGF